MKDKKSRLAKFIERTSQMRAQYTTDKQGLIKTIKELKAASVTNEPKKTPKTTKFELNSKGSLFTPEQLNEVINNFKNSKK